MIEERIFLDAHTTTPADPALIEAMLPWWKRAANTHSAHEMGREAAEAVERARAQVVALIGADPDEIVFVPSATIATNIALRSLARAGTVAARSAIEHPCVIETLADLEPKVRVIEVLVSEDGLVDPEQVAAVAGDDASVVVVMSVNNEVGTIQPIAEIADICGYLSAPLFVDLAQAAGRIPLDVHANNVAAGAVSSHKLYGPQGVAALYCRRDLLPVMRPIASGGQERGLSPGTLPTALCVGFGEACALALDRLDTEAHRLGGLRDVLMRARLEGCPVRP